MRVSKKDDIIDFMSTNYGFKGLDELSYASLLSLYFKYKKIKDNTGKRPTRIAVDIDGVIADFANDFLVRYNKLYNKSFTKDDIADYGMSAVRTGVTPDPIKVITNEKHFYKNMTLLPTAERFKEFYNTYDVIIITAVSERNSRDRIEWIYKMFPDFPRDKIYFTHDKFNSGIDFDYIIEDNPNTFGNKKTIAYRQNYNEYAITKFDTLAVSNWNEIVDIVAKGLFIANKNNINKERDSMIPMFRCDKIIVGADGRPNYIHICNENSSHSINEHKLIRMLNNKELEVNNLKYNNGRLEILGIDNKRFESAYRIADYKVDKRINRDTIRRMNKGVNHNGKM